MNLLGFIDSRAYDVLVGICRAKGETVCRRCGNVVKPEFLGLHRGDGRVHVCSSCGDVAIWLYTCGLTVELSADDWAVVRLPAKAKSFAAIKETHDRIIAQWWG